MDELVDNLILRKQMRVKAGYRGRVKAATWLLTFLMCLSMLVPSAGGVLAATVDPTVTENTAETTSPTEEGTTSVPEGEASTASTTAAGTKQTSGSNSTNQTTTKTTEGEVSLISSWPEIEQVEASAYVVIDASTLEILAEHNAHTRRPMASTTKILTALSVINHPDFDLDRIVTVSSQAISLPSSVSARVGLKAGEELTTEECLYGLMVHSGNDCANVLAENYSPSRSGGALDRRAAFCKEATEYAHSLGAKNTSIKNPSGFTVEGHYSTAYDLALLAQVGLQDEIFSRLVSTSFYRMPATNMHPVAGWKILRNTNGLVLSSPELYGSQYFQSYDGVKTGTTSLAGKCLVGAGTTHDDRQIIATVLDANLSIKGTNLTIDVIMRALLEEGAKKLGVEPIREDLGTSGQGFIALPDDPVQETAEPTDEVIEVTEDSSETTVGTISEQEASTSATSTAITETDGTNSNNGIFSGDLSSFGLIALGVLMVALVVVLIILGVSIRKDKRKPKR
ncbi:MAG TPA: D-alanyl-D-alanine carboxypeptidase [Clostridiaceae bacterium]|nr:D-alanyl-D-alanine carboxypeptidase [Clostridiaceae bacterium]